MENDDILLVCEVSKPNVTGCWMKAGKVIEKDSHFNFTVEEKKHTLIVQKAQLDDEANYEFKIMNKSTKAFVKVKGKSL